MTADAKMDSQLSAALDHVALGLDRVAGCISDFDTDARAQVLPRLQRIAADMDSLLAQASRQRGEPAQSP